MKKWRCTVCGQIVESDVCPSECPVCHAKGDKFVEVKDDEMSWAAEHVVGIAKGVPEEIVEGLRANFNGECSEVGMYLGVTFLPSVTLFGSTTFLGAEWIWWISKVVMTCLVLVWNYVGRKLLIFK